MLQAAREWTDAGLMAAGYVTVNINPRGIPIRWIKKSELAQRCNLPPGGYHGCTSYTSDEQFEAILVADSIDDARLRVVLMHELIHVLLLLDAKDHTPGVGIFNAAANADDITQADLDWLCRFTDCVSTYRPPKLRAV